MHKHAARHDDPAPTQRCVVCEEGVATLLNLHQEFAHGSGDTARIIRAVLPVWSCNDCGLEYLDAEGESAKQEAIYRAFERLTPAEIRAIRRSSGLNQKEFADALNCGIASVKRWELGTVIQNQAADEGIRKFAAEQKAREKPVPTFPKSPTFPPHVHRAAQNFKLRLGYPKAAMAA
jgi:putative zinc finger/helix-turn-helix YgiT family protein